MTSYFSTFLLVVLFGGLALASGRPASADGSKCHNVSCSPPIPGAQCTPKYERDDGCCPVWYCYQNGATSTIYGKTSGGGGGGASQSSSWSSSSSTGNGNSNFNRFPSFGPIIQLPNLANLFG